MVTTPQDWRITASMEGDRCMRELATARIEPLAPIEVLAKHWLAYRAAAAAVGALAEAELEGGMTWAEIATGLGFPDASAARDALAALREDGFDRLRDRLPRAAPPHWPPAEREPTT